MSTPVFAQISFSVDGAAEATGISATTIRAVIRSGDLPARYYGPKTLILANDLFEWVDGLPDEKRR